MATLAKHPCLWTKAGILAAGLLLGGCFLTEAPPRPPAGQEVAVKVRMGVAGVKSLRKGAVISLDKLVLVMTSSGNDTIRDTIRTPVLDTVATSGQTINQNYNLRALRSWKVVAYSLDRLDSVIHRDSATIPALYAGETAVVSLNLSSRFVMYDARFMSLPDSIESATPGQPKQKLNIKRLVLKVDGQIVRDSTAQPGYFASLTTHTLSYDYVATGTRSVQLLAYGPMGDWDWQNDPLYDGSMTVHIGAGVDSTASLNLAWVGPTTGTGSITVELGKVGKLTIHGNLPGTVSP